LITYTRTWSPEDGIIRLTLVRRFLRHFYQWETDITAEQCGELGLIQIASWTLGGQTVTVYERRPSANEN